jgi:DNA-nicking Smr family endonuclease|tara:strand:+ start:80 stop:301 length:222 start_codon:yes stop_codon:yes gene_type:complete
MKKIDLHGIKHQKASNMADTFIRQNKNNLPVEIITGNSLDMQNIIKRIVKLYGLRMEPKTHINLGSYIINNNY